MLSSARGLGRFCLRWPGLVVFVVTLLALVFAIATASMYALADPPLDEQGEWAPGGEAGCESRMAMSGVMQQLPGLRAG